MDLFKALMLGIVQGTAEFLPISSSGHLVIFQKLFGLDRPEIFFDVCLHMGTLAAVIVFFRKDLSEIVSSFLRLSLMLSLKKASFSDFFKDKEARMAVMIAIGSVPTAIAGILIGKIAENLFSSLFVTGTMLAVTGYVLHLTGKCSEIKKGGDNILIRDAIVIGLVQGIAIMPGISRSGSTVAAGLFLGLSRETAARYSFLLSVPAVVGAGILSASALPDHSAFSGFAVLSGTAASAVTGYFALKMLIRMVKRGRLFLFAPYCWFMASLSIISGYLGAG